MEDESDEKWDEQSYWRKDANGVYAACKWENNNCVQDGTYTHDDIFKWTGDRFELRDDKMEFWKGGDDNPNCDNAAQESCKIWSCDVFNEQRLNSKCYPDHDKVRIVKISGMKHENDC